MVGKRLWSLCAMLGLISSIATAQDRDVKDLLKDALGGYVKKKAGEQGFDIPGSDRPDEVHFDLADINNPLIEEFTPLHTPPANTPPANSSQIEKECQQRVQGQIAWDQAGRNKKWSDSNVVKLCRGAVQADQPPTCFHRVMQWGRQNAAEVHWQNALGLCAGSTDARRDEQCFIDRVRGGAKVTDAVKHCGGTVSATPVFKTPVFNYTLTPLRNDASAACEKYVQDRIAWDPAKRNKHWNAANLKRLCQGTTSQYAPGNCFKYVLHDGAAWGQTDRHNVQWSDAVNLCAGTSNARQVTGCFKDAIARNFTLQRAITQCKNNGEAG